MGVDRHPPSEGRFRSSPLYVVQAVCTILPLGAACGAGAGRRKTTHGYFKDDLHSTTRTMPASTPDSVGMVKRAMTSTSPQLVRAVGCLVDIRNCVVDLCPQPGLEAGCNPTGFGEDGCETGSS